MKLFSIIIGLLALFVLSCATPSEPEIEEEQEKLTYETLKNTTGYVYDLDFSDNYIYSAEDQAGYYIYDFEGNVIDNFHHDQIKARTIMVSETESLVYIYNQAGTNSIMVFHQSALFEEFYFQIMGQTTTVKNMFSLSDDVEGVLWLSSNYEISSNFLIDLDTYINKVYSNDGILYVSGSQLGIFVTDYETEEILQTINTPGVAMDVKYVDNTLFAACKEEGFVVIDITDLDNPITTVNKLTEGWAQSIAVEGNILAIGSGGGGVYVYDISEITNPTFIGRVYSSDIGYTYVVKIFNDEIYAGTKVGIFKISIQNEMREK